jgi:hypothetical protein
MSVRSPTKLQLELLSLMEQQVDSLESQTFGAESEYQLQQYVLRRPYPRSVERTLSLRSRGLGSKAPHASDTTPSPDTMSQSRRKNTCPSRQIKADSDSISGSASPLILAVNRTFPASRVTSALLHSGQTTGRRGDPHKNRDCPSTMLCRICFRKVARPVG